MHHLEAKQHCSISRKHAAVPAATFLCSDRGPQPARRDPSCGKGGGDRGRYRSRDPAPGPPGRHATVLPRPFCNGSPNPGKADEPKHRSSRLGDHRRTLQTCFRSEAYFSSFRPPLISFHANGTSNSVGVLDCRPWKVFHRQRGCFSYGDRRERLPCCGCGKGGFWVDQNTTHSVVLPSVCQEGRLISL